MANDYLVKDTTYVCYNLLAGHEYEFRIRAKNAAGFSKPSPPSAPFKLKSKFNVPSPPGTPQVVKVGKNYVDLKWEAPVSDGGSRITGYVIEKREVGSALWAKCNEYNVTETEYTVMHLIERGDYEFRIDPSPAPALLLSRSARSKVERSPSSSELCRSPKTYRLERPWCSNARPPESLCRRPGLY